MSERAKLCRMKSWEQPQLNEHIAQVLNVEMEESLESTAVERSGRAVLKPSYLASYLEESLTCTTPSLPVAVLLRESVLMGAGANTIGAKVAHHI